MAISAKLSEKKTLRMEERYAVRGEWVCVVYLALALVFMPLVLDGGKYYTIQNVKLRALSLCVASLGTGLLVSWLVGAVNGVKLRYRQGSFLSSMRWPEWALLAYLGVSFLSALFSVSPRDSWLGQPTREDGFLQLAAYAFIFFALARAYRPKLWHAAFPAAGMTGVCVLAILQSFGWHGLSQVTFNDLTEIPGSFLSTLGNVNVVSTYLCVHIALFAFLFVKTRALARWAFLPLAVLGFFVQTISNADAGYFGMLAAFLIMAVLTLSDGREAASLFILGGAFALTCALGGWLRETTSARFYADGLSIPYPLFIAGGCAVCAAACALIGKRLSAKVWRILVAASLGAAVALGIALVLIVPPAPMPDGVPMEFSKHVQLRELLRFNLLDEFGSYRGYIWKNAASFALERPLLGFGPDAFGSVMIERTGQESMRLHGALYDKAHNEYIQILLNGGFAGLLSYLAFLGSLAFVAVKRLRAAGREPLHPMFFACLAACAAYAFQAVFTFAHVFTSPYFWTFAGMLTAMCGPPRKANA